MMTLDDLKKLASVPAPCLTIFHSLPVNDGLAERRGTEIDNAIREAQSLTTQASRPLPTNNKDCK
ncbi:MAG TPA: hypothetical protein VN519_05915 [Bryobacteraceae bacterium]|nr:hypothetical protein [Bryobacteraceae bacterium]